MTTAIENYADNEVAVIDPTLFDLLIVDDDAEFRATLAHRFLRRGFRVQEASCGEEALQALAKRQYDVLLLDMVMPGMSGIELLERLKSRYPETEALLLTGQGTIETAVQSMKLGAYDYLTKPFPLAELEALIQKACLRRQLAKENAQLKAVLRRAEPRWEMVGRSGPMRAVYGLIERAGPSEKPILVLGESGTGKELVARALHQASPRADKQLVTFNCAAMPEQLLESELFGHEKGSFTGATAAKPGLFEMADGGTLFIDEIGEMPLNMQPKLLRVLEDGSLRRVGSIQERRVNVRVITATNRDLAKDVAEGKFREDLYYRINVMTIELPPLRERPGDIALLVGAFLGGDWQISAEAVKAIEAYSWPGNVRQLINVIDRAKILAEKHSIQLQNLPREILAGSGTPLAVIEEAQSDELASIQRAKVREVLQREKGNKSRAARTLGVNRRTLYRLLDKYGLHEHRPAPQPNRDLGGSPAEK